MEARNGNINSSKGITCVEVVISRKLVSGYPHTLWPLSVYSLENHPVRQHPGQEEEVFHFMVYDWERTIKDVLDDNQIPYSISRYFYSDKILPDDSPDGAFLLHDTDQLNHLTKQDA